MGNLEVLIKTAGRPAVTGGGSGGGPNKGLFPKPEPLATLGLNSNVVYGTNVQVAFPLNFQVALGGNLQICINPNSIEMFDESSGTRSSTSGSAADTLPQSVTNFLGSGPGGNMQFTMGTSANFVVGQSFDINLGPRRITLDVHTVTGIQSCMGVIGKLMWFFTFLYALAYLIPNDDFRIILTIAFQGTMQLMIGLVMDVQGIYDQMEQRYKDGVDQTFSSDPAKPVAGAFRGSWSSSSTFSGDYGASALVFVVILPIVFEIIGEIRLDVDHDAPQTVVDSSGQQIGTVQDN